MTTVSGTADILTYVAQLIDLERQSGAGKVYRQDRDALTRRSATLTDLRSHLNVLDGQAQAFGRPGALSPFAARTVTSSAGAVATATATAGARTGTHTLLVTQLAKRSTVVSAQWSRTGTEVASAAGAGSHTIRVTVDGVDTQVTVTVGAADDNATVLNAMAAAINASGAKVSASVVHDTDSTARVVLRSDETGSAHAIGLADESGTLAASTGIDSGVPSSGAAGGFLYAGDQLDARVVLDGLAIVRGKNTVEDVLPGVTFTLLSPHAAAAAPATLTVGPDQEAIRAKAQAFLDAYNTAIKFLKERTQVSVSVQTTSAGTTDVTSVTRGTLASESAYLGLLRHLRSDVGGRIETAGPNGPAALSEIGITAGKDGTLSLSDATRFAKALTEDADGVAALFNSSDGIAARVSARLRGFLTSGGRVDSALEAVTSRLQSVNRAIAQQETYLKAKQATLVQQYSRLQETLLRLQGQQAELDAVLSSITW